MPPPEHEVGGVFGGLTSVFTKAGRAFFVFLVGEKLARGANFQAEIFVGGFVTGLASGIVVGAIYAGTGGAIGGALGGGILGLALAGAAYGLVSIDAETHAKAAVNNARMELLRKWETEMRSAGISAHEIQAVYDLESHRQDRYLKKYGLNRQDGMAEKKAHEEALSVR